MTNESDLMHKTPPHDDGKLVSSPVETNIVASTNTSKDGDKDDGKVARDAEPTADDLAELAQIVVDFDDCEETQASDKTLHRLVELGFLECIRYCITAKGSAAIKEQRG